MSALGHKRTFECLRVMSALPPKADMARYDRDVRFVPKADVARSKCEPRTQQIGRRNLQFDLRSDLKPERTSSEKSFGCSQAAKCPPLSTLL
jgi:hypothetical protein